MNSVRRPPGDHAYLNILLLLALATASAGCAQYSRREQMSSECTFRLSMSLQASTACPPRTLTYDPSRAAKGDFGVHDGSVLRVEFPLSAAPGAELFARRVDRALAEEWRRQGIVPARRPLFQLIPVDCWPAAISIESRWPRPAKDPYLPIPLPLLPPEAPMSELVGGARLPSSMFFAVIHELAEYALASSPRGTLLSDSRPLPWVRRNFNTRWFREGAATLVASDVCARLGLDAPYTPEGAEAALARVGAAVIGWNQSTKGIVDVADYYDAAFGVALRIAAASPARDLARVMEELRQYDYIDGDRLAAAIQTATGRRPEDFAQAGTGE